jgi:hypothetical protein
MTNGDTDNALIHVVIPFSFSLQGLIACVMRLSITYIPAFHFLNPRKPGVS